MKLRIEGKDHGKNTKVYIDGEEAKMVEGVVAIYQADDFNKVILEVIPEELEIDTEVQKDNVVEVEGE